MIDLLVEAGALLQHIGMWSLIGLARHGKKPHNIKKLLELGAPLPDNASCGRATTFINETKDPYLLALWNASLAGNGKWFLAKREHETFLAIKAGFEFPDPIAHIILSSTLGPAKSIKAGARAGDIAHELELLNMTK